MSDRPSEKPNYQSQNPEEDWRRFENAMQQIVSVPKEEVDKRMAEGKERRNGRKGKAK